MIIEQSHITNLDIDLYTILYRATVISRTEDYIVDKVLYKCHHRHRSKDAASNCKLARKQLYKLRGRPIR